MHPRPPFSSVAGRDTPALPLSRNIYPLPPLHPALALPAFLRSVHATSALTSVLSSLDPKQYGADALIKWVEITASEIPPTGLQKRQKFWDAKVIKADFNIGTSNYTDDICFKARNAASSSKEGSAWLHALPASLLGSLLDDSALTISVGVRLGAPVVSEHTCVCGETVHVQGLHGLVCRKSAGRPHRHSGMDAIIARGLRSAGIMSELEPLGIFDVDGKRPDGVSVGAWECGKPLAWDVTCVCTMGISFTKPLQSWDQPFLV